MIELSLGPKPPGLPRHGTTREDQLPWAARVMLNFVLLQNRAGKTRLSKYYRKFSDEETQKIEGEIHRIVTSREGANAASMCSFVEVSRAWARPAPRSAPPWFSLRPGVCRCARRR